MSRARATTLGPGVCRPVATAYVRVPADPIHRPLRIFTGDPTLGRLEGRTAVVEVPYEPLHAADEGRPGEIVGRLFAVSMTDYQGNRFVPPGLDDFRLLMESGHAPSESNPRFHAQMVYAVASQVHCSFRRALGRQIGWSFGQGRTASPLMLHPFGSDEANAWYDAQAGEIRFGSFQISNPNPVTGMPQGWVFTALSHDIVAHEVTHAVLDGLRPHFMVPSSCDVAGFHEGFADLVALFHHFQHPQALRAALARARGRLEDAQFLHRIAPQFGQADGEPALRTAMGTATYAPTLEAHDMGGVLMSAVFDAFRTIYQRKTARLRRIATGGTGELPPGDLPSDLLDALVDEASTLAAQFLSLVIRAVDYCPPTDIKLGEFLRAMITADAETVADDHWGYREALIDAFRRRGVLPKGVISLSEDSLLWHGPQHAVPPIPALSFGAMQFNGDPGQPMPARQRIRQARALGQALETTALWAECGLARPGDVALQGAQVGPPQIESIRSLRRAGPDGTVTFGTVAEVSQRCTVPPRQGHDGFEFTGGATVVLSPTGEVRLVVGKSVAGRGRIESRQAFLQDCAASGRYWETVDGMLRLKPRWCKSLHEGPAGQAACVG